MKVGNGTDIPVKSIEIIQTKASVTGAEAESKNARIGTNLVKISAGLIWRRPWRGLVILDLAGGNPRCIETYDYDDEDGLLARKGFYHYIYRGDCLFFKRTKHH